MMTGLGITKGLLNLLLLGANISVTLKRYVAPQKLTS